MLGLLPQELLGTSMYEYFHVDDIVSLAESHKAALQTVETVTTVVYLVFLGNNIYEFKIISFKNRSIDFESKKDLL